MIILKARGNKLHGMFCHTLLLLSPHKSVTLCILQRTQAYDIHDAAGYGSHARHPANTCVSWVNVNIFHQQQGTLYG